MINGICWTIYEKKTENLNLQVIVKSWSPHFIHGFSQPFLSSALTNTSQSSFVISPSLIITPIFAKVFIFLLIIKGILVVELDLFLIFFPSPQSPFVRFQKFTSFQQTSLPHFVHWRSWSFPWIPALNFLVNPWTFQIHRIFLFESWYLFFNFKRSTVFHGLIIAQINVRSWHVLPISRQRWSL